MNFKNGKKRIFLILGDACNMNCVYCKAHLANKKNKIISKNVSPKVLSFLKNTIENEPTLINFYGGEPLLYFDTIKYIIDSLAIPVGNVIWSTMTNGRNITPKMVEYINKNHITVNFSWDGMKTSTLRGYDVLANEKLRDCILSIEDLWINSTLTTLNYPLEIADAHRPYIEEYKHRHGRPYLIHIGLATPTKENDPLYAYDYERIYREVKEILYQYVFNGGLEHDENEMTSYDLIARTMLFKLKNKTEKIKIITMDMDINGNFFICPFSRKVVDTLDTLESYMEKAILLSNKGKCKANCPVAGVCDGGCPQLKGTALFSEGCKLRKHFYGPILDLISGRLATERCSNSRGVN